MNNSKLAIDSIPLVVDSKVDVKPQLRKREEQLLKIIEAIRGIEQTKEWSTLKTEVFDSLVNILEKDLRDEAKKETPDTLKLNRLAGQLKWAEKYADLHKLEEVFRLELSRLRTNLYESESRG